MRRDHRQGMVTEVERTFRVDAPVEDVWELIADPEVRARAISIVDSYEMDGDELVWHLKLPIPGIRRTISVRTRDVERDDPRFVQFVGRSKVMDVRGEHELSPSNGGSTVRNRFVVEGKLPGIERFFERNIDDEMDNLLEYVSRSLGLDVDRQN